MRPGRRSTASCGAALSVVCLALAGCASTTGVTTAGNGSPDQARAIVTGGAPDAPIDDWRRVALGDCCSFPVPAKAEDVLRGALIDSEAAAHFRVGGSEIIADLTSPTGLTAVTIAPEVRRNVQQASIDGYQNTLRHSFKNGSRTSRLSVTVICPEKDCELATRILGEVEISGKRLSPVGS